MLGTDESLIYTIVIRMFHISTLSRRTSELLEPTHESNDPTIMQELEKTPALEGAGAPSSIDRPEKRPQVDRDEVTELGDQVDEPSRKKPKVTGLWV